MKNRKIFPASVLEQSAEWVLGNRTGQSGIIYVFILASVLAAFVMSFHVTVKVNANAPGIIKPRQDHIAVYAGASGYASACPFMTNSHVNAGDTLFTVRPDLVLVQLPPLEKRQQELLDIVSDLKKLTAGQYSGMKSPVYVENLQYYLSKLGDCKSRLSIAENSLSRSRGLSEAGIIPLSEYETVQGQYLEAKSALESLTTGQRLQWQSDMEKYAMELRSVESQISEVSIRASETVVLSPADGTIVQLQPVSEGTYVTPGQCLMEISPDGDLIAECYVSPMDIGYFHKGMHGRLQVSSYKYTEWGMLDVTVTEVADDVTVAPDGSQSFYKVFCRLSDDHLTLKNGTIGPVRKGMTVNGNFLITERTAFQLLYDKIDDWINPNTMSYE